ncbi:MAG: hypothetical protein P9X24_18125 [Candidatus Hatepunaea meridiana]|nr:hypothetical protein [Candidatus Hatepunaea meridiana]
MMSRDGVLLDSEPCRLVREEYIPDGFPKGSCPSDKEGSIEGFKVRCLSWDAMYFEFLGYIDEVPKQKWQDKDIATFLIIQKHITWSRQQALRQLYESANKRTAGNPGNQNSLKTP